MKLLPATAGRLDRLGLLPARPTVTDPEMRHTRMLESILGLLHGIGEQVPVVLAIEDLQSADAGTRSLATFLARVSRPGRLCVLATYQPDQLTRSHPLRAALAEMADGTSPPQELPLPALDRDELVELIEGIEGERPSASVLLFVAERSRGNALVAEEILAARRELAGTPLTGSLDELAMARLAQRTPECRRILRLLAPAGEPLRIDELAAASESFERDADRPAPRSSGAPRRGGGILEPDLAVGLVEALAHGFVALERPTADGDEATSTDADPAEITPSDAAALPADVLVGFRHELIARAVEADLLPGQRRRHHSALAAGLSKRPGSRARHHLLAHEPGQARAAAIEAAAVAEAIDSPGDALAHLELALELDDRTIPRAGRADANAPAQLFARAAEAAFADGRPHPGGRLRGVGDRPARRADRPGRLRAAPRAPRPLSPGLRRHRRRVHGPSSRARAHPARAIERACPDPCLARPGPDVRGDVPRGRSPVPRGDRRRPRRRAGGPGGGGPRAVHARHQPRLGRRSRDGRGPAPRGQGDRRGARPHRRQLPGHRQPDDGPRRARSPARGDRGLDGRGRGCPRCRPGGHLRQLPPGQRLRVADPARPLGGGAGPGRYRARVEPGRGHVRRGRDEPRRRRGRDEGGRGGRSPARTAPPRARDGPRRAGLRARLPRRGLVRALAR